MKKLLIVFIIILLTCSCSKKEIKVNNLKIKWPLNDVIKPSFSFQKSLKKDKYDIFYNEKQITLNNYIDYIKLLEKNNYSVDWRYSDTDSSDKLNDSSILDDGYINYMLCNDNACLFTQYVDKEKYNSINKDAHILYSFKIEIEQK